MELAFWDPTTVGVSNPMLSFALGAGNNANDPMQAVRSMGFEEMLQWMEADISKDLGSPAMAAVENQLGMDQFRASPGAALMAPEPLHRASVTGDNGFDFTSGFSSTQPMQMEPMGMESILPLPPSTLDQHSLAFSTHFESSTFPSFANLKAQGSSGHSSNISSTGILPSPFLENSESAFHETLRHSQSLPNGSQQHFQPQQDDQQFMLGSNVLGQQLAGQPFLQQSISMPARVAPQPGVSYQPQQLGGLPTMGAFPPPQSGSSIATTMIPKLGSTAGMSTNPASFRGGPSQMGPEAMIIGAIPKKQMDDMFVFTAFANNNDDKAPNGVGPAAIEEQPAQRSSPKESSLQSQMLQAAPEKNISQTQSTHKGKSNGQKQGGRSSAKSKLDALERQLIELQSQHKSLTDETSNMQCRMNILDRMLQLRKDNSERMTEQIVRLGDQIQMAELIKQMETLHASNSKEKPHLKSLSKLFPQDHSTAMFNEITREYKEHVEEVTNILQEIDNLPPGTDVSGTPVAMRLDGALKKRNQQCTKYQSMAGGAVAQHWIMHVYETTLEEQPTIEEEFNLNYRQIYPLLRLTPEQKKRVKVSFEIFKRRCEEVSREREELREQINTIDNSLRGSSGVDRCREVLKSEVALWKLRCYDECMKECHLMMMIIVFHKILTQLQFARLIITSYPFPPCPYKMCEVINEDLNRSMRAEQNQACTTSAEEMLKMVKLCPAKAISVATFTS